MTTRKFVTADLHLAHGPAILRFRDQFSSPQEHDDHVIWSINQTVGENSTLVIAGDVAIKAEGWERLRDLKCRNVVIVPGNHCGERSRIALPEHFRLVGVEVIRLPGTRLGAAITHVPVHPQCLDRWHVNLHGHLHEQVILGDDRYVCVSLEQNNYRPIAVETLVPRFTTGALPKQHNWPEWVLDRRVKVPEGL